VRSCSARFRPGARVGAVGGLGIAACSWDITVPIGKAQAESGAGQVKVC